MHNHELAALLTEAADRIDALEVMLNKKLDLISCGIGANYSGDPKENEQYVEIVSLLNNS